MLVPNCIFRSNGAAILLSNKSKDSWRAKYELKHVVRTTISNDEAYGCVYQMEDDKGERVRAVNRQPTWVRSPGTGLLPCCPMQQQHLQEHPCMSHMLSANCTGRPAAFLVAGNDCQDVSCRR
jgi:hypothetical protein